MAEIPLPPKADSAAKAYPENDSVKRVLIVGISSYLGSALATGLRSEFDVVGTYRKNPVRIEGVTSVELDCLNSSAVVDLLKLFQPEAVIYCAGVRDAERAAAGGAAAEDLHTKGPSLFFKGSIGAFHFIYFSTDQVFGTGNTDAQTSPFKETDLTLPLNLFAQSKLQGEALLRTHARFTHVFRLAEVFGEPFGSGDRGSRASWIEPYRRALERGETVVASREEFRTPLYVGDLVRGIRQFLRRAHGDGSLRHLAGRSRISRFDFLALMAQKLGLDDSKIRPVAWDQDPTRRTARPRDCGLDAHVFEEKYAFNFQTAEDALEEFGQRLRIGYGQGWD